MQRPKREDITASAVCKSKVKILSQATSLDKMEKKAAKYIDKGYKIAGISTCSVADLYTGGANLWVTIVLHHLPTSER